MKMPTLLKSLALGLTLALLGGCVTQTPYDYTAFKQSKPRSILVMPPVNSSPDVQAGYSMLSHVTLPLSEAGYYVLPVAVVVWPSKVAVTVVSNSSEPTRVVLSNARA